MTNPSNAPPNKGVVSCESSASPEKLPPFDLETYISRYDGQSETRLQRLLFLAHHLPQETDDDGAVIKSAYEMAVRHMKDTGNYRRYLEEFGAILPSSSGCAETDPPELSATSSFESGHSASVQGNAHGNVHAHHLSSQHAHPPIQRYLSYEAHFIHQAKAEAQHQLETLEGRLATAQTHITKESIRTALLALAEFHRSRGELREALRRVSRSREYCSNARQHAHACLLAVELSVDLREWSNVRDTVARAEHTGDLFQNDPLFRPKLRCALALAHLSEAKYSEAAKLLTALPQDFTNQFSSLLSAEDVAMYGALLGLATMDRRSLHSSVLDGMFKARLELVPPVRDALRHYSRAEYGPCLRLLHTLQRDLLLDIHLRPHVPALLDLVRDRCIVQYFRPYSSVSLANMGKVFGYDVEEMEGVVARLMAEKANGGSGLSLGEGVRINALTKTLSMESDKSVERKARRRARVRAAKMGVEFVRNAESLIMRLACIENGVVIRNENPSGWRNPRDQYPGRVRHPSDPYDDRFELDDSTDDDEDAMDVDDSIVNPNDF